MGTGILKVCGMCCIDLNKYTLIKNIRCSLSYNKKTKRGKDFLKNCKKYSTSIENMENKKPYTRRKNHWKNRKSFWWKNSTPKIKHETLSNDY